MHFGLTGRNHQRLQLGNMPFSMGVAETQLGTSHSLQWPYLCFTMLLLTQKAALPAGQTEAQGCGQLNHSGTQNVRFCGSVLCSMDAHKEIPADNFIFGLVVYFRK